MMRIASSKAINQNLAEHTPPLRESSSLSKLHGLLVKIDGKVASPKVGMVPVDHILVAVVGKKGGFNVVNADRVKGRANIQKHAQAVVTLEEELFDIVRSIGNSTFGAFSFGKTMLLGVDWVLDHVLLHPPY